MNRGCRARRSSPPRAQALKAIQARNRRKVIWILTAVPPKRPTVMDQGMAPFSHTAGAIPDRFGRPLRRPGRGGPNLLVTAGKTANFELWRPTGANSPDKYQRIQGFCETSGAIGTARKIDRTANSSGLSLRDQHLAASVARGSSRGSTARRGERIALDRAHEPLSPFGLRRRGGASRARSRRGRIFPPAWRTCAPTPRTPAYRARRSSAPSAGSRPT